MDQYLDKATTPLKNIMDWIMRLVISNLMFVVGTIAGLGLFGFFPSFFALFHVIKRLTQDGEDELKIPVEFFRYWKKMFWKSNGLGLLLGLIAAISAFDLVYAYETFMKEDTITVFGVLFSMVALLFSYVSAALMFYVPITTVYFEKFSLKDTFKFAVLSIFGTPLLTLQLIVIATVGYLVFSVLISVSFFLGVSLPVYWMFLAVGKRYRKFFLEKEAKTVLFMNYKYISNKIRLMDVLQANLPDDKESIDYAIFEKNIIQATNIHHGFSTVAVLKQGFEIFGCLIVRSIDQKTVEIELAVAKKETTHEEILAGMLDVLLEKTKKTTIETILCNTDKREYHPHFSKQPVFERLLLERGFSQQSETQFVSTR